MKKKRVAVLISGRGSNMRALVAASQAPRYPAEIVTVISNRPDAPGLAWAKRNKLATVALDHKTYGSRQSFEQDLQKVLETADVELVALAGFMRLMTPGFVERWRDRMINIHPSLLPSFKGLHTHEQALEAGVKIAGCTVHFLRPAMDAGPIIAQAAVPVLDRDTPATLAARILAAEHVIYPSALALVASGKARCRGEKVVINQKINVKNVLYTTIC